MNNVCIIYLCGAKIMTFLIRTYYCAKKSEKNDKKMHLTPFFCLILAISCINLTEISQKKSIFAPSSET